MELESKENNQRHKIEVAQRDHESMMIRKEKELGDIAKYGVMKDLMGVHLKE